MKEGKVYFCSFCMSQLGMQIASIRSSLEKGLAVSTEMAEEMGSLEVWLEQSETELKGCFPDKEAELEFLRVRTFTNYI